MLIIVTRVFLVRQQALVVARHCAWRDADPRAPDRTAFPSTDFVRKETHNSRAGRTNEAQESEPAFPGSLGFYFADKDAEPDQRTKLTAPMRRDKGIFQNAGVLRRESLLVKDLWWTPSGEEGLGGYFPNLRWGYPIVPRGVPGLSW